LGIKFFHVLSHCFCTKLPVASYHVGKFTQILIMNSQRQETFITRVGPTQWCGHYNPCVSNFETIAPNQEYILGWGGPNWWTPWHLRVKKVLKMSTIQNGCIPKTNTYSKNLGYVLLYTTSYDNQLFKCLLNLGICIKSVWSNGGLLWHGCLGNITIFLLFMTIKYKKNIYIYIYIQWNY